MEPGMTAHEVSDTATALNAVLAYHRCTKHRFEAYAPGPQALDWDAQPAPFRHFVGTGAVRLPRLAAVEPGSMLHEALQRPFAELGSGDVPALPPDTASIGALLQLALGITAWKSYGPDRWALRANPSSGNLHPTEAYLFVRGVAGLADGIHHYRPEDHALELRAAFADHGDEPRLGIVLASAMWREAWKYGERAFRYCQLDTGHAAGALRYAAAALGWRLSERQVGSATLASLAGLDRAADFPAHRYAETEREEAEILLWADWNAMPTPAELQTLAGAARFQGTASTLDANPLYRWPIIEEVAAATRQADGVAAAPTLPAASATTVPDVPVAPLIEYRRSAQRFDPAHVMPLADFAAMLARLLPAAAPPWDVLAAPPRVALAFFIHRVAGLVPGLYLLPRTEAQRADLTTRFAGRFEPTPVAEVPGLLRLAAVEPTEWRRIARSLHCHQDIAATACFAVGMLTEFDAALAEGAHGYRQLFRECGLIGQALYLDAEARGLRGTGIGCFFDDPVHELLGLDDETWQTLYHFTVGLPLLDARIETAPGYPGDLGDSLS
jgi:SagB-type dehydrogenase family enzyme